MSWKSEQEKLIMAYFREVSPDFPPGKLIQQESPDFVLEISPKTTIGIELTQIPNPLNPHPVDSGFTHDQVFDQINEIIQHKETKIPLYLEKKMKELWLLIHIDDAPDHLINRIRNKIIHDPFPSSFHKTLLFFLGPRTIISW